jgi:hypothetical protein
MAKNKFTIDYFTKKFENTPKSRWICGEFQEKRGNKVVACALGHCGVKGDSASEMTTEGLSLTRLFVGYSKATKSCTSPAIDINDNGEIRAGVVGNKEYIQLRAEHPRTRILTALKMLKEYRTTKAREKRYRQKKAKNAQA